MMDGALNLLRLRPDPQHLSAWAARYRLLGDQGDLGYALHGLLSAAFGDAAPQPFRYFGAEQGLLAYTAVPELLRERAALANADVAQVLGLVPGKTLAESSLRPFPESWPPGHLLAFEIRVRPVVRRGTDGAERDAFLAAVEKAPGNRVDREAVYCDWLREQLSRHGGATIETVTVVAWRLLDVMRQSQRQAGDDRRRKHNVHGPEVLLSGHLRVADPHAFGLLLRRGIGRHRAFGFGMLLLRPATI